MTFTSILFRNADERVEIPEAPDCFTDLFLDQVIDAVTAGRQEYNLKPFFYTPLQSLDAIRYRQEVMRDLEAPDLLESIESFAQKMRTLRIYLSLAGKVHNRYNQEGWHLAAIEVYCEAVTGLADNLAAAHLESRGFLALREYLSGYVQSDPFVSLMSGAKLLRSDLSAVQYGLVIRGSRITVQRYRSEPNLSVEVERVFEKFRQGSGKDYSAAYTTDAAMNHVEAKILKLVARLFPDTFAELDRYCTAYLNFVDTAIVTFDREVQFYVAYREHISRLTSAGLKFCYPEVSNSGKDVYAYQGFDLALARKLVGEGLPIICNDFSLSGQERILVVSGPNQGGKTTFARTFGQTHYLARLGLPVPGREARLTLFDRILTHFEREEHIEDLHGKLEDDLFRIHDILEQATPDSIIIMNEIFTSTTLRDGVFLSRKIMERLSELDALCVYVTFIVELASLNEKTVSVVSTVDPENPAMRTYKILRKPADGLSYAISIAEKHSLTYESIRERLKP